jgi:hypothetical protein
MKGACASLQTVYEHSQTGPRPKGLLPNRGLQTALQPSLQIGLPSLQTGNSEPCKKYPVIKRELCLTI